MDERLIRESDVIKLIDEWLDNYPLPRHVEKGLMSHKELLAYIAEAPTIEVKTVVHAHWNADGRCTNCGEHAPFFAYADDWYETKYCHGCGAQMDEVVVEENATTTNNAQKVSVDGVKIPVISMKDVPKLAKEMEK